MIDHDNIQRRRIGVHRKIQILYLVLNARLAYYIDIGINAFTIGKDIIRHTVTVDILGRIVVEVENILVGKVAPLERIVHTIERFIVRVQPFAGGGFTLNEYRIAGRRTHQ